jgi:hypothetical protein
VYPYGLRVGLALNLLNVFCDGALPAQGLVAAPARRTAHDWHLKGGCAAGGKKGMAGFLEDQQDK